MKICYAKEKHACYHINLLAEKPGLSAPSYNKKEINDNLRYGTVPLRFIGQRGGSKIGA